MLAMLSASNSAINSDIPFRNGCSGLRLIDHRRPSRASEQSWISDLAGSQTPQASAEFSVQQTGQFHFRVRRSEAAPVRTPPPGIMRTVGISPNRSRMISHTWPSSGTASATTGA
jgi:hypothetical protein